MAERTHSFLTPKVFFDGLLLFCSEIQNLSLPTLLITHHADRLQVLPIADGEEEEDASFFPEGSQEEPRAVWTISFGFIWGI